jgi:hypothetical protein
MLRSVATEKASEDLKKGNQTVSEQGKINLESAWRAHAAQEGWAAKVDTKASIFLAVDGVVLSAVLTARRQEGSHLASLDGWPDDVLTVALVLCGIGGVLAIMLVFPILGGRDPMRSTGTIYFGDLRRRRVGELAQQLASLSLEDQFTQVSQQLVAMAWRTWLKHRLLQAALTSALAGYLAIIGITLLG